MMVAANIPPDSIFKVSCLLLMSVSEQAGSSLAWFETRQTEFEVRRLDYSTSGNPELLHDASSKWLMEIKQLNVARIKDNCHCFCCYIDLLYICYVRIRKQ